MSINVNLSVQNLPRLIAGGESKWLEFKSAVPPDSVIAKHLVAFANTEGGVILFGIGDKGTLLGIAQDSLESSTSRLRRLTSAVLPFPAEIGVIEYEGRSFLYVRVPPAPDALRPLMTAQGEVYVRHADHINISKFAHHQRVKSNHKPTPTHPREVRVFVAMSFREEEEPALVDYYRAMERVASSIDDGVKLERIDIVEGDYEISQQIMTEIDKCQILVADFTLSPRNVYFEAGYCRGKSNIHIIQTARKDTSLEFDVRNWRTLFYKNATELESKLKPALEDAVAKVRKG